jgi:hypothetical protein
MDGSCSAHDRRKKYKKILLKKPEQKRPLRRINHRWEDIKMDFRKIMYDHLDWIHLAQERDQ